MQFSPKLLVTTLLIVAVPAVVGVALTTQNLSQNAQIPSQKCGGLANTQCPQGFMCKLINPSSTQSAGFCIPLPLTSIPISPVPPQHNPYELSCSDCQQANKDTLCLNMNTATASCQHSSTKIALKESIGTLCVHCPQPKPTGACTPRPACLDTVPPCKIPEPVGGWCALSPTPISCGGFINQPNTCPPGYMCDHNGINPDLPGKCIPTSPAPSVPPGCKVVACTIACPITNPNCCPVKYICPGGSPQPITNSSPTPIALPSQ